MLGGLNFRMQRSEGSKCQIHLLESLFLEMRTTATLQLVTRLLLLLQITSELQTAFSHQLPESTSLFL